MRLFIGIHLRWVITIANCSKLLEGTGGTNGELKNSVPTKKQLELSDEIFDRGH